METVKILVSIQKYTRSYPGNATITKRSFPEKRSKQRHSWNNRHIKKNYNTGTALERSTELTTGLAALQFHGPVKTNKVMSGWSVYFTSSFTGQA